MTDKDKLKYYLEAIKKMLEKQNESHLVLDLLGETIEETNNEKEFFGDGYCLLEEVRAELENL